MRSNDSTNLNMEVENLQCRTCLCKMMLEDSKYLFTKFSDISAFEQEKDLQMLAEEIKLISGVSIIPGENLPEHICATCLNNLYTSVTFIKTVRTSDKILRQDASEMCFPVITIDTPICLSQKQFDELEAHNEQLKSFSSVEQTELTNGVSIKSEVLSDEGSEECYYTNIEIKEELDIEFDGPTNKKDDTVSEVHNGFNEEIEFTQKSFKQFVSIPESYPNKHHICSSSCISVKRINLYNNIKGSTWIKKVWHLVDTIIAENKLKVNVEALDRLKTQVGAVVTGLDRKMRKCNYHKTRFLTRYYDWLNSYVHMTLEEAEPTSLSTESQNLLSLLSDSEEPQKEADEDLGSECIDSNTQSIPNDLENETEINEEPESNPICHPDLSVVCALCDKDLEAIEELKAHVLECHSYEGHFDQQQIHKRPASVARIFLKPSEDPDVIAVKDVEEVEFSGGYSCEYLSADFEVEKTCEYCRRRIPQSLFEMHVIVCAEKRTRILDEKPRNKVVKIRRLDVPVQTPIVIKRIN